MIPRAHYVVMNERGRRPQREDAHEFDRLRIAFPKGER
jgi:hypothetical protein